MHETFVLVAREWRIERLIVSSIFLAFRIIRGTKKPISEGLIMHRKRFTYVESVNYR